MSTKAASGDTSWLSEARRRGVLRVAASYAVIAWLLLQIADVTFGRLGVPTWVLTTDEDRDVGPPGVTLKQGLTAKLYVYRQLGRADRARAVLDYYKEHVLPKTRTEPGMNALFTEIAGVEAVEGRRTEAIAALRTAMKACELPPNFMPQLPWFASLKGTPGYAELLRERERRIAKAKAEFAKIDAEFKVPAS